MYTDSEICMEKYFAYDLEPVIVLGEGARTQLIVQLLLSKKYIS